MVLNDVLFADMSYEQMIQVMKPKIDGSNHLAEVFHDDPLEFFVMFSSLSAVVGNPGQSNYAVANAYMQTLARRRRKRGLAASTFDIGRVVGIGYVERADPIVKEQLIRQKYLPISETEFHQFFAETILASHPRSKSSPVLTTVNFAAIDGDYRPRWADDPRFSHCIVEDSKDTQAHRNDRKSGIPVIDQLANATTTDEAWEIIKASFAAELRVILQLTDQDIDHHVPLIEHGIDSLIAVEVRSWFVKELKVDIPVLKILGGASIASLSKQVMDQLPKKIMASSGKQASAKAHVSTPPVAIPVSPVKAETPNSSPSSASREVKASSSRSVSSDTDSAGSSASLTEPDTPGIKPPSKAVQPSIRFLKSELLSYAQSRFWFLRLSLQDETTFNVTFYYKVSGNLRIDDLKRAVRAVGSRHEALRTCFVGDTIEEDVAYQKIMGTSALELEHKKIEAIESVTAEYANL
ncbi:KR domain-containing protein [Xylariaceae sp. FL0016]|nr:KR domain-containing protein [Xylariaceae sp. FL0016]